MLQIKSLKVEEGKTYEYLRLRYSNDYFEFSSGYILDAEVAEQPLRRLGEYLNQGGVFDRFGNKSVLHGQFKGTLTGSTTLNGWKASSPPVKFSSRAKATFVSVPPRMMVTKKTMMVVLNETPLVFTLSATSSGQEVSRQAFVHVFDGNTTTRRCAYAYAWVRVNVRAGKWTGSGVTVHSNTDEDLSELKRRLEALVGEPDEDHSTPPSLKQLESIAVKAKPWISRLVQSALKKGDGGRASSRFTVNSYSTPTDPGKDLRVWLDLLQKLGNQHQWSSYELSRHARDVIEAVNDFGSNAIAFVSDLRSTGDTVRSLLALPRNLTNPKAWASAWLSFQFGDRLQIADTRELLESLRTALLHRQLWTKARRRMVWENNSETYDESHERVSTIYVANESYTGLMTTIGNLMRWDAWPTLENSWDLVPLSFLVDWVVPVSDLLAQIDAAVEAPYLKTLSQYISDKSTVRMLCPLDDWTGVVSWTVYRRYKHNVCGDVRPFDWSPSLPSFSVVHTLDVVALLVQTI